MAFFELFQKDRKIYDTINLSGKDPRRWKTPVTLVVITKRHHARFCPKSTNSQNTNLACGKVFDSEVVTPKYDDFYLQSHDSPLGTARGSHYVVIVNNNTEITTPALQDIVSNSPLLLQDLINTLIDESTLLHWLPFPNGSLDLCTSSLCGFCLRPASSLHATCSPEGLHCAKGQSRRL